MLKKTIFSILLLAAIAVITLFTGRQWLASYADSNLAINQETIFVLPAGTGNNGIVRLLQNEGIVNNSKPLLILLRLYPEMSSFKAGTYRLSPGMTIRELFALFKSGKEAQFSALFVEGSRFKDWLAIIAKSPYIKHTLTNLTDAEIAEKLAITNPNNPEGWFIPDTYFYTNGTSDITLLKRAKQRMELLLNQNWQERDKNLPYKTPYEMLIMASIIEKETSIEVERKIVSSVFVNRLRSNMRLQTDPTVIYGMGDQYNNKITRKDLTTLTPYNTYMINGLPPTPIAIPGIKSIEAAAHPANSSYYYFVATGNGGHKFSENLKEHNKAVKEYLQNRRMQRH